MFTIPRLNVIESDSGFSVEVLGRTGLLYVEGDHSLRVDAELLARPAGLAIYSENIKNWQAPHAHESIDPAKKSQIIENIRAAFELRGFDIDVL